MPEPDEPSAPTERPEPDEPSAPTERPEPADSSERPAAAGASELSPPPSPTAVRSALVTLPLRPAGERFWNQLDMVVAEESPMQISPRPAIRPITEPPPRAGGSVGREDVFERGGQGRTGRGARDRQRKTKAVGADPASGLTAASSGSSGLLRRAIVILLVLAALVGLAALGGVFDEGPDEDTETGGAAPSGSSKDEEDAGDEGGGRAEGQAGGEGQTDEQPDAAEVAPTTPPPPAGLETDVPLHAGGLGPLRTGAMTLGDVESEIGIGADIDRQAFTGSGGACFEAFLPGADDLTLWIRNPDPATPLDSQDDGVLVAITLGQRDLQSERVTDLGLGLGVQEEDLVAWYQGTLSQEPHPYYPGGSIYLSYSDDGSGNGIAYVVGSGEVIEIRVGAASLIRRPHVCA